MPNVWSKEFSDRDVTKFGKWLERNDITIGEISKWSGVSRPTVSKMVNDSDYEPSTLTLRSIKEALRDHGFNPRF